MMHFPLSDRMTVNTITNNKYLAPKAASFLKGSQPNLFQNNHSSAITEPWQIPSHAKQRPCDLQTSPSLLHQHHHLNHQSHRVQVFLWSLGIVSSFISPILLNDKMFLPFLHLLVTRPKIPFCKICLQCTLGTFISLLKNVGKCNFLFVLEL